MNEAWKTSLKSGLAASFGLGLPYLITLSVVAATVYLSGKLLDENKIAPGFVLMVSDWSPRIYIVKAAFLRELFFPLPVSSQCDQL